MLNLMLALVLVTSNPDSEVPNVSYLMPLVQQVAVQLEILDSREKKHIFVRTDDFVSDVKLIRRRYHELIDAPLLCDSIRFPNMEYLTEATELNRRYDYYLHERLYLDPRQSISMHEIMCENDRLYHIYDLARDAQQEYYYVESRREALQKLRDEIGPQAYYAGCLPAPVPVWRLQKRE